MPSINRNLAIYGHLLFDNGTDNYAYALDARTGKVAWETKILDYRHGAQHTSGPIVANGKVISGRGCEPEGGPEACVITAFDADTGKELWRTRTIPEARRARQRDVGRRSVRASAVTSARGWCRASIRSSISYISARR